MVFFNYGLSLRLGIALYENHISILQLSQRNYDATEITTEQLLVSIHRKNSWFQSETKTSFHIILHQLKF
jgi:hypothetical protein